MAFCCFLRRISQALPEVQGLREVVAWLFYVIVLWGCHHLAVYQSALRHELVHAINH